MTQTKRARLSASECRHPFQRPPRVWGKPCLTSLFPSQREGPWGPPHTGRPRRLPSGPARQPTSPQSSHASRSSLRTGALARDAQTPEGALPVPGATAFSEEWSSPLSVLPMLFQLVPFSSWPLALPPLPTSPQEPRCPGRARTLRSLTQPDGRGAASGPRQALGSCPRSSPRVPATGSETS